MATKLNMGNLLKKGMGGKEGKEGMTSPKDYDSPKKIDDEYATSKGVDTIKPEMTRSKRPDNMKR